MNYHETRDEINGGLEQLESDFTMLKIWQTNGGSLHLTAADDTMTARTYTFAGKGEAVFAIHRHGRTRHQDLKEKLESTPDALDIELVSPHGHLKVSRVSNCSFQIKCNRNGTHEDSENYWETVTSVETDGDVIKLELSGTQSRREQRVTFRGH